MRNVQIQIDSQYDLTTFTVVGKVAAEVVRNAIQKLYEGNVTMNVLWDLSGSDLSSITSSEINGIAKTPRKYASMRTGGKTAIVAPTDLTFGLTRMYGIMTEVQDLPFETQVFRTTEEAHQWLLETE